VKKRNAAKSARRPAKAKKTASALARASEFVQRYAIASTAGALVLLLGAAAVLWAGGYVGLLSDRVGASMQRAAVSAGFKVQKITLIGRNKTAAEDVGAALGPVLGASLLHLDLNAARLRIEHLGWVRSASVSRLFPNTLHVSIRERAPVAVWQMSGKLHLIDSNGAVIQEIGAYEYSALPLVVGAGAPEAASELLQALGAHPEIMKMTAALVRVSDRRWNLRLRNDLDVKLPDAELGPALDSLAALHRAHRVLDQPLEYIDVRDPDRLVLHKRGEPVENAQTHR
jgi:cell division protein FtsQ